MWNYTMQIMVQKNGKHDIHTRKQDKNDRKVTPRR